jgi:septum site-determining protein MinC
VKESVVIKSSRYGIHLILNDEISFDRLLCDIKNKFVDSEKFFGEASVVISFEGRDLTSDEQCMIIDCITDNTSIKILCVAERDEILDEVLRQRVELKEQELKAAESCDEKRPVANTFYRGALMPGEEIAVDESIVIIGDVPRTSCVVSKGSIIVLGTLAGSAFAGMDEGADAFIAASDFKPEQFNISGIYGKLPSNLPSSASDKHTKRRNERQGLFSRKSAARLTSERASIARLGDGFIVVSDIE